MARQAPIAPRARSGALVLGHRGASAEAPENTLAAFRLALAQGADGFELDAWRCRSGEVVVGHDERTARVAGVDLRVPEASLEELRALDVGAWKGEAFRGERMPLLEEVLEAFPAAVVNVELKSRGGDLRLASAAARVVARAGAGGRVLVSSFDWSLLVAFRIAAPAVPVGLLFDGDHAWRLRLAGAIRLMGPSAVHPERRLLTPARARAWGERGLAVNVWTVDDPGEARGLAALGAAGIITNVPARIRQAMTGSRGAAG
jgi:glycerophosphoryl diester phosphodiesterase